MIKLQRFAEISLKKKVVNAFDETCLTNIKEDYIGCNNFSMSNTLKHLCKRYVKATDADSLSDKETMSNHWDPDTPIDIICKKIEDRVKFATFAGLATQDKEKNSIACKLVH